jgi:hypothetical protein
MIPDNTVGQGLGTIALPTPRLNGRGSLESVLQMRRSVRAFGDEPLTLAEMAQVLWAAQGVVCADGMRTAPSAGALYPLEIYAVLGRVAGLASAVYKYLPEVMAAAVGRRRPCARSGGRRVEPAFRSALVIALFAAVDAHHGKAGARCQCPYRGRTRGAERAAAGAASHAVPVGAFDERQGSACAIAPIEALAICCDW